MPLYFRCDSCLWEDEVYPWDAGKLERICDECGIDGCFKCIPDSLCPECYEDSLKEGDEE